MKKKRKTKIMLRGAAALFIGATLGATSPACAVEPAHADGIDYIRSMNIAEINRPDALLTRGDMLAMLVRATYGSDIDREEAISWAWLHDEEASSWYTEEGMSYSMTRGEFYETAFIYAGVQELKYPFYHAGKVADWSNYTLRLAQSIGLCDYTTRYNDKITIGEACNVIYRLQTNRIQITPREYVLNEEAGFLTSPVSYAVYQQEMDRIPKAIMQRFINEGWKVEISPTKITDMREETGNTKMVAFCQPYTKTIATIDPYSLSHEFGHFLDDKLYLIDNYPSLFEEAAGLSGLTGSDYCMSNKYEFIASAFAYWQVTTGDEYYRAKMQEVMPETYDLFSKMEKENWWM